MMKLSLPSEFAFPSVNVDQTKTEFEIFFSTFRAVNHEQIFMSMANKNEVGKSVDLSKINRQKGNEAYSRRDFKTALEYYYLSLACAPYDSIEYGLAIANRTAGFFSIKRYEECLLDIENIWHTKYPEAQFYKIFVRQSLCFIKLEQYSKAFECNVKARVNLNKFKNVMSLSKYGKAMKQINDIFFEIKPFDADETECQLAQPELKNGENPKFLNASNVVDLKYNDLKGRYVVAKTDIEKGDILFIEKPYGAAHVGELKYRYTYCSHCLIYNAVTIPCNECTSHFYCSENCKQLSWNKAHKWECCGERKNILTCAMRLLLNIMFKAAENNFKTIVDDESVYGNKINDNFAFVDKLVTNKSQMTNEEISEFTKVSIWLVIYLKKYSNFFIWLREQASNSEKSATELFDWIGGILLKLCMQIQCNSNEIVDASLANLQDFEIRRDYIAFGLYVSTSMINHSCTPNALVSFQQDVKIIRATKDIKKGMEITVKYAQVDGRTCVVDPLLYVDVYKFTCTCEQCSFPLEGTRNPWICFGCEGRAFDFSVTDARCSDCQEIFSIRPYKHIERILLSMYLRAVSTSNSRLLDNILTVIKTIYHPEHQEYVNYFIVRYEFYLTRYNATKCLKSSKMFVEYCESHCNTELQLQAYLRLMNVIAIYYGLMQQHRVPFINYFDNYFCRILEKTKSMLKFFVSPQNIKAYDACFRAYLVTYN